MVDEVNKAAPDKAGSAPAANVEEPVKDPTLAEDYLRLEQINLLRAVIVRMQGGRHPDKAIEALLQRRLNFSREEFQGPYAIRLVCSLMMVFVVSTLAWAIVWAVGSAMNLSYFLRLVSTGLATLFAAMTGVAIFHSSSIPEEKSLIEAIEVRLGELRKELGKDEESQPGSSENAEANVPPADVQESPVGTAETPAATTPETSDESIPPPTESATG